MVIQEEKNKYTEEFKFIRGSKAIKKKEFLKEKKKGGGEKPEKEKLAQHVTSTFF